MRSQTRQKVKLLARALRTIVLGVFAVFASVLFAAGVSLLRPTTTTAATSSTINFQARLETSAGAVAPDGTYNVSFHLFSASSAVGGTSTDTGCGTDTSCEWTEQYTYNSGAGATDARVRVVNGYLTVNLGSLTAFSGINWNQQQWLTMDIGGTVGSGTVTWDGQMSPRLLLTATPYAFQAGQLGATNGSNVATLSFAAPTANDSIVLPDASGTVCLQNASVCGFATGSGSAFLQGGNSFGVQAVLGTNDGNSLAFRTNGTNRLVLDTSGNLTLQQASTLSIASAATGRNLTVQGGAATSGTNTGGNLILQGGAGAGTGASGSVIVQSNTNNSMAAFQIQDVSSNGLFTFSTSDDTLINNATSDPGNLLENGGFESAITGSAPGTGASGWILPNVASIVNSSANAHSGNQYLSVAANGSIDDEYTAKYYRINPGDTLYLEGWVNTVSASGTGGYWFQFLDKDKNSVQFNTVGGSYLSAPTSWTKVSGTAVVPSNAYYLNVAATVRAGATGTWRFDDVVLKKVSSNSPQIVNTTTDTPTAFQVQNASGASLFTADTTNGNLVLGSDGTPSALTVRGGAAAGSSVTGSSITFDTSNGTGQANSGDFIFRSATGANQVGVDNSATGTTNAATSLTISYTTGSQSNRLMIVSIATKGTISGTTVPQYNGTNLTKLGSTLTAGASTTKGEVWYLVAPASGTHNLVITATGSTNIQVVVATLFNVNQASPLGTESTATGTGATASVSSTTNTTETVVSTIVNDGNVDVVNNQSQTVLGNVNFSSMSGMSYKAAQGTSTTMSWDLDGSNGGNYAVTAVPINSAASSATTSDTLTERMRIDAQGRVGIGTATPGDQLDIASGGLRFETSGSTLNFASDVLGNTFNIKIPAKTTSGTCASGNQEGLRFVTPGSMTSASVTATQVGHICMAGGGTGAGQSYSLQFFANAFTASSTDLAENYSDKDNSLQSGDLVSLDPTTHKGVKKTSSAQDPGMIGIVSTAPGLTLSDISDSDGSTELTHPKPIALSGRVPTKVSTINGEIHVGDYLTSSPIPGVAVKATTAGQTVARALEDYTNPDPNAVGSILSFVNLSWADPSPQSVVNAGDQLQTSLSNLVILRAASDATQTFAVQNSQGEALLSADTIHMIVTVKNLVVTNTLTINGHIVTGGTTPTAQVLVAGAPRVSTGGPVCSATGDDTSGLIQLAVGANDLSSGVTCEVTFAKPYDQAPRTVFSPTNQDSIGLAMYVTASPTDMALHFTQVLPAGHTYTFNYLNLQ